MKIIDMILEHLVKTSYENLPKNAIEATKRQILDTLAATIGGSTCNGSAKEMNALATQVKEWGGKEESTIVSFGGRVPAPSAALVNGTLAMRLDFDDTHGGLANFHPSKGIVPTAFAIAEHQGNVNGKELVTAITLGHDLTARMREAVGRNIGTQFVTPTNFIGAAATAGKILRLDEEKMGYALSLAYHQINGASGISHITGGGGIGSPGPSAKGLNNGFACQAGLVSAQLAKRNFPADANFLEETNKYNFYDVFFDGFYAPEVLTENLGKVYEGVITRLKEFPCCHGQHDFIRAALGLMKQNNIQADTIENVTFHAKAYSWRLLSAPVEQKQNPQHPVEAQFSISWGIASALVYGEVGIGNFSEKALQDTRVRNMAHKVFPKLDSSNDNTTSAIVVIKTKNGNTYSSQGLSFGSAVGPSSLAEVASKFRHCCEYSINPISKKNQDKVIQMVEELENVKDSGEIVRLLG